VHAASRATQDQLIESLEGTLSGASDTAATAAATGSELFEVADLLDTDRSLRTALIDQALPAESRTALANGLLADKVSGSTRDTISSAVEGSWSNTRDLRHGLVELGRRALLRAAREQGQSEKVVDELYDLARLLEKESELEMLLADRLASPEKRRELLAKVLYGHVSAITEALALQVVGRPVARPVEDLDALCGFAAGLNGRKVARVRAASALSDSQEQALGQKLEKIYGSAMSVHSEVDPSLLGGAVIRVGDEVIDGSTAGKLSRLRRDLA
jgi:F-type H+-transporting ATPase subunit delta